MKQRIPQSLALTPRRRERCSPPRGFTLVEVLLSMSLVVVLIVAVYAALDIYRNVSTSGRDQVLRSQIARAIQQKMAIDIRSVIYKKPEEESSMDSGGQAAEETTGDGSGDTEPTEPSDPAEAAGAGSKGVVGNSTMLVLNISKPPRGLDYSSYLDGNAINSRTSDLLSVTYLIAGSGEANLAQMIAENDGTTGLARIAGDRLALDDADESGNEELLAASGTVIAAEVSELTFRYFDGTEWFDAWDSRESGTLPRAIEVTIGFRNDVEEGAASAYQYRFVITLPAADPMPADTFEP